jgi:sulfur transfer complex TusBCD TusB component (DsrH family)
MVIMKTYLSKEYQMAEKEVLVVASKIKAYIKSKNMKTSSDTIPAVSDKVYAILDDAIARTKANRRSTVKPQDL